MDSRPVGGRYVGPAPFRARSPSLRAFYRYLMAQSVIAGSPVKEVRVPKVRKKLPVYLRRDTMDELLDDVEYCDDFEGIRNKLIIETVLQYRNPSGRADRIA